MIRSNAGSLADLQLAFQDYVLASSDGFTVQVRDTSKADRVTLLDVYRHGYALRLIEVLTMDFPGVRAIAGPEAFDTLTRAYIASHPSRHPSVRWFGRQLADFLTTTAPYDGAPALAEMARFEWALGEAFDSVDAQPIRADAVMALPPEAWETIAFAPIPSLQCLAFTCDVPPAWRRREEVEPGTLEVATLDEPVPWVIWRPERVSNFRSLERDEAAMLGAMIERQPFPALCEALLPHVEEDQAAARAAGLLRAWVEEGMIGSFSH
ncbi:MAG: putative DNA-binding domain-containing protein [Proteobacteria bacterium]|nr:putative DNA-binding domain-containing protein [Pseudomonadota bacterium]